jgi:hypothetical protein
VDFTIDQQLTGTPEAVQELLLDRAFIDARAGLPKLGGSQLLDATRDGERAQQRIRFRFTGELAPAVTAVIDRERLTWVDEATYDLAACRVEHEVKPDHYADRLSCRYSATIAPEGDGALRRLRGTVKVRMMLVGGKVEGAIVSGLRDYAAAEAVLIDDWLARAR